MTSENKDAKKQRPPIVVVMGHVDHGKTTLLDYIRKTNSATREAGGITQSIGAYEIEHGGRRITFIDTPGHEAFSSMRSRGAEAADIAILVVAADEGVKPQTKEALQTIQNFQTPFIVAVNKTDKTQGDIERVKTDLASTGVLLEGSGGNVSYHGVSAKTGEGTQELLDLILLAADLENLDYDPDGDTEGYILEARRDPRRGVEVAVIIKNGKLSRGAMVYTKTAKGKVRVLENFLGKPVETLTPSAPARIVGFEDVPKVGELFSSKDVSNNAPSEKKALVPPEKEAGSLTLILKANDAGSLDALGNVLRGITTKNRPVRIISESIGDITDGDIKTAIATGAVVVGFKNKVERGAKNLAEAQKIRIITSDIVYDLEKAVEDFVVGSLGPEVVGELNVLAVFNQEKLERQIIGGKITKGSVKTRASFDVISKSPPDRAPARGKILSLRDKKAEIQNAEIGSEIGLLVNCPLKIATGDTLVIKGA